MLQTEHYPGSLVAAVVRFLFTIHALLNFTFETAFQALAISYLDLNYNNTYRRTVHRCCIIPSSSSTVLCRFPFLVPVQCHHKSQA